MNKAAFLDRGGVIEYSDRCSCRKPWPGMLLTAAREHQVELGRSWMIGDADIDIEAGKSAGCKTVRLLFDGKAEICTADLCAPSLLQGVHQLLEFTLL